MQQRQLVWLIGALVLLLLIAFVSGTFNKNISTIDVPELSFSGDSIERMTIQSSDTTSIVLARQQGQWTLTEPIATQADSLIVTRLTNNLGDLELESVVSTNPEKYNDFGVGDLAQSLIVSDSEGSEHTLTIGNSGPDFQSMYVRLANDPRVFLTSGRVNLPPDVDTWRDKTIFNIPALAHQSIAVTRSDETYEVRNTGSEWEVQSEDDASTAADSAKVLQWLTRFSPLKAIGFSDQMDIATLKESATHQLHFTDQGGAVRTMWILESDTDVFATTSEQAHIYRLTKSMLPMYVPESNSLLDE